MMKKKTFWANLSKIKPHRNKKGFTLIELIVAIGLIAILLMGAVTIFSTAGKVFATTQVRNRQQLLMDGMMESISTELRYSTKVEIGADGSGGIFTDGKDLYIVAAMGTEPAIKTGYNMELTFERIDDYTILVKIALDDGSGTKTERSSAIRLINCELTDGSELATSTTSGGSVSYVT